MVSGYLVKHFHSKEIADAYAENAKKEGYLVDVVDVMSRVPMESGKDFYDGTYERYVVEGIKFDKEEQDV